jgi:aspartate aminotransferase
MKVTSTVDRLRRGGIDVIDLGAGEPDFATPDPIAAAAHAAIDQHFTRYTPVPGTLELRRAIRQRYQADYGVDYAESEIITSAGGKQALFNTALALFGPGDEVITHAPCWPTLTEQVRLAGAAPVLVRATAEDGFAIRARPILEAFTARTRGVIINSPCNPTGAVMSETELTSLAMEAARRDIWLVLDLCYEKLIYEDAPPNLPAVLNRHARDRSILCGSASKAYAMTGWRCGWAIGPSRVIAAENALQSHATSNVNSIAQKAVLEALSGSQAPVLRMREEYRLRRDRLYEWLQDPRIVCVKPAGAFYMFLDVQRVLSDDGLGTSAGLAEALLDESRVAVTPGEAFDAPGFVRISFATSMENLREGSRRLLDFVDAHAPREAVVR